MGLTVTYRLAIFQFYRLKLSWTNIQYVTVSVSENFFL